MFVVIIIFIIIVAITKYVSVGSMFCALLYPFLLLVFAEPRIYVVFGLIVFAVVIYKHIPNIKRLISGAENKIKI